MRAISNDGIVIQYDAGIKDAFGNKVIVLHNTVENAIRLYGKSPEYKSRTKEYAKIKGLKIVVPKMLEVIDITRHTLEKLKRLFPDVWHRDFQIHQQGENEKIMDKTTNVTRKCGCTETVKWVTKAIEAQIQASHSKIDCIDCAMERQEKEPEAHFKRVKEEQARIAAMAPPWKRKTNSGTNAATN